MNDAAPTPMRSGFWSLPPMRYPNAYVWLVFVASLDVILTFLVLYVWDGREVNPIAAAVIDHLGFLWAIVFKFATVVFVILMCEFVGRRRDRSGRALAVAAVVINGLAVTYTFGLLLRAPPVGIPDPLEIDPVTQVE